MIRRIKFIVVLLMAILTASCYSNKIHFEIREQSINSCNQKGLGSLYIYNEATSDTYHLIFNDTVSNDSPKRIVINSISKSFSIYEGWQKKLIENESFRLAPLSHYSIERAQGDASGDKIEIWTDENGKVIRSSRENCEN